MPGAAGAGAGWGVGVEILSLAPSLIHPINKTLLSPYYVPGMALAFRSGQK